MRQLLKGNEAIVRGAIAAGCKAFFGYPITPASEIAEAASLLLPEAGGIFIPAESEISAVQMVYGAASAAALATSGSGKNPAHQEANNDGSCSFPDALVAAISLENIVLDGQVFQLQL